MAKHPQSVFGKRLREAREKAGLPQDRLGVLIGLDEFCSSARISRYETGTHAPPFAVAESLAAILDVPVAYFYCPEDATAEIIKALHVATVEQINLVVEALEIDSDKHENSSAAVP